MNPLLCFFAFTATSSLVLLFSMPMMFFSPYQRVKEVKEKKIKISETERVLEEESKSVRSKKKGKPDSSQHSRARSRIRYQKIRRMCRLCETEFELPENTVLFEVHKQYEYFFEIKEEWKLYEEITKVARACKARNAQEPNFYEE